MEPQPAGARRVLGPEEELELAELRVRQAGLDERDRCFNPGVHPKPPRVTEEPVVDGVGNLIDLQRDSPTMDADLSGLDLTAVDLDL